MARRLTRQAQFLRRLRCFRRKAPCQPQPRQTDRQVDQKDAAPSNVSDQRPAHRRSRRERGARARQPYADRTAAIRRVRIGVVEKRIAAPTPCTARVAIKMVDEGASGQASDAIVKTTNPP
jgi:hypothetical protein